MASNFFIVPEHIFFDRSLSALEVKLWTYVHRFDRTGTQCYRNDEELADVLGCHIQSVRRLRARLLKRGYLSWHPRNGIPSRYISTLKKDSKMPVDNLCITCGKLCHGSCGKLTEKTPKNTSNISATNQKSCSNSAHTPCSTTVTNPVVTRLQKEPVDNIRNYSKEIAKIVFDLASPKNNKQE